MRLRTVLPLLGLVVVLAACGSEGSSGQAPSERTYLCSSYDSLAPGTVVVEPPC